MLVVTVVVGSYVVPTRIDVHDIALVPEKEQDKKKGREEIVQEKRERQEHSIVQHTINDLSSN